jgi:hypothetical protein
MAAASFFMSCGGDESLPANRMLIDGESYEITGMYFDAQGGVCRTEIGDGACTHNRYIIYFTDGVYGEEDLFPTAYSFYYMLDLRSPDTEELQLGVYDLVKGQISVGDNDAIAWSSLDWVDNYSWEIEGELNISGSFPDNVTFKFDATVYYYSNPDRTEGSPDASFKIKGQFTGEALPRAST